MERQPISREGYEKIRKEIEALEETKPAILERIKTAREEGDLKENAEYHAARETLAHLERQIGSKRVQLSHCQITEKTDGPKETVTFGSTVRVKDLSDDMEEAYELVGPGEENYDGDVMKILTSSPIASALLGKKVGETAEVEIPRGTLRMEIVAIH